MCMFCRSLFFILYFFFWPLCCLFFFNIRILITSLWYLQTLLGISKPFLKLFTRFKNWYLIEETEDLNVSPSDSWYPKNCPGYIGSRRASTCFSYTFKIVCKWWTIELIFGASPQCTQSCRIKGKTNYRGARDVYLHSGYSDVFH
jgi:hypothetical protein